MVRGVRQNWLRRCKRPIANFSGEKGHEGLGAERVIDLHLSYQLSANSFQPCQGIRLAEWANPRYKPHPLEAGSRAAAPLLAATAHPVRSRRGRHAGLLPARSGLLTL